MDIRPLTEGYAVSPQISPRDLSAIRDAGFRTVLCNRPDSEVSPDLRTDVMEQAAKEAGLDFVSLPIANRVLSDDMVAAQKDAIETSPGPIIAYCASGTRSTIAWALGQAGTRPADDIIDRAARAGYDIEGLRPHLK